MNPVTITLTDEELSALQQKAASDGVTPEEFARALVSEALAEADLPWEAVAVLELFRGLTPGQGMGGQTLVLKWGTKPRDSLWKGYDLLKADGYIEESENQTNVALTEKGYEALG